MVRSNFHTHTVYCDGTDTPAALAEAAFALGFAALGFTGHSNTGFDPCGMTPEGQARYRAEVAALREAYRGRMEIYCGVEQDYFSGRAEGFDYAIGSVHYVNRDGAYLPVDWLAERTAEIIRVNYGGDANALAEDYYALVGQLLSVTGCQIIGHFDLLTKYDEAGEVFSASDARYRAAALGALDALCPGDPVFEINTGAMARGTRQTPYPALWLLREMLARRCRIMINSDCHDKRRLNCSFDDAAALARAAGFRARTVLRGGEFVEVGL